MKKIILSFLVLIIGLWSVSLFSQVEKEVVALGLPGDNLNLYAVLDIFQNSKTIEEFERKLNLRDANVNNLDLNNDNSVDYISVISYNQGHFHSIVLRVPVNSNQFQDVAVIEVSKNSAGNIIVQVIGDEALYGQDYVIEPSIRSVSETANPAYIGDQTIIVNNTVYGNGIVYVTDWPIIGLLFSPSFSIYVSPWHWGYYPVYWNPWRPILYFNYWSFHNHYYRSTRYYRTSYIRFPSHHSYYLNRRSTSAIVTNNRRAGTYNSTYGGRDFRRPNAPPRVSRRDLNSQNRESTRQRVQSSTRQRNSPSSRQENRESTRRQVQPATKPQDRRSRRQDNLESTRYRVQPATKSQDRLSPRQENVRSMRQQVPPSNNRSVPSAVRQSDRQIRQSARQTAREIRQLNRNDL